MDSETVSTTSTRRTVLSLAVLLPAVLWAMPASARRTPSAAEGPYYPLPSMRVDDSDNDLVRIQGRTGEAKGDVIRLKGRVFDRQGQPVSGARVEIWQTDANGRYQHARDPRSGGFDRSFQGFGAVQTDGDGSYSFRTIKPVSYPGRTPHIHVKVHHSSGTFTTQFYIAGHPQNRRDGLYRRMSTEQQKSVEMSFFNGRDGVETNVDIRL